MCARNKRICICQWDKKYRFISRFLKNTSHYLKRFWWFSFRIIDLVLRMLRGFYLFSTVLAMLLLHMQYFIQFYIYLYILYFTSHNPDFFYSEFVFNSFYSNKITLILFYVYKIRKNGNCDFFHHNCPFKEVLSISQLPTSHNFEFISCNLH